MKVRSVAIVVLPLKSIFPDPFATIFILALSSVFVSDIPIVDRAAESDPKSKLSEVNFPFPNASANGFPIVNTLFSAICVLPLKTIPPDPFGTIFILALSSVFVSDIPIVDRAAESDPKSKLSEVNFPFPNASDNGFPIVNTLFSAIDVLPLNDTSPVPVLKVPVLPSTNVKLLPAAISVLPLNDTSPVPVLNVPAPFWVNVRSVSIVVLPLNDTAPSPVVNVPEPF